MNRGKYTSYKIISKEYYDQEYHPTCSNFREGSKILIKNELETLSDLDASNVLEVGAGKSVLLEICHELNLMFKTILISDAEEQMLKYSFPFKLNSMEFKILDAENTDMDKNNFDLIVSSLGDSYNTQKFWIEVEKLLKKGGHCIFTTPSFKWCRLFRKSQINKKIASIVTKNNNEIYIPSIIYNEATQIKMIEGAGLNCHQVSELKLKSLNQEIISPKLRTELTDELPVVTCYVIKK
jgi:2-polyprenyl-3-methyl-5-hydroxy-6-metoxy-1,4-benzoquinol methylase